MSHLHKLAAVAIVCALGVGTFLAVRGHDRDGGHLVTAESRTHHDRARAKKTARQAAADRAHRAAVARAAHANELGEVPILMIHHVLAEPQASLDRTPQELYQEFTRLAKENYVPVTAAQYVTGRIDIPAGTHPVVLTFDDGSPTHLAFDANGHPKPDTAVGVILRVAREHPRFRPAATFFVNEDPFVMGDKAPWAMRWLVRHGFEVANHTTHHLDMSDMSKAKVDKEIGTDQKMITDATGKAPVTFAFPFGALSKEHLAWADHGKGEGVSWNFKGMFLAGWKPADSPFMKDFDPLEIPRIRSEGKIKSDDCERYCSTAWLDWLDEHPDKRYTSDGDPATVAFPRSKAMYLTAEYKGKACPY